MRNLIWIALFALQSWNSQYDKLLRDFFWKFADIKFVVVFWCFKDLYKVRNTDISSISRFYETWFIIMKKTEEKLEQSESYKVITS